ncbi:phage terminase small subunit P27 family [uncultured Clostridium sp.]|jgi:P27 family predicted phage terminase small subunit|uniref:phage terminase small subunit P27 family n=1 Tax=uncultured Clostridium sp. TaxID=59620 RepID=UPI00261FA560|nr:phage terminase small subunit P27 family [uncultured Clostridium sp.]
MAKKIICPKWLDDEGITEWKRIVKLLEKENKDFTHKDIKALEGYCANYSKWKRCEELLLKKGFSMVINEEGYEQQRPEVAIANKAQQEMRSWMKELGITPASRARMTKTSPQNLNNQYDEEMEDMVSHG